MSKILIIGVGGGGRNAVQKMKESGIPANFITFGGYRTDYENGRYKLASPNSDIPHYDLLEMNGLKNMPYIDNPAYWAALAENVKDEIGEIIESHLNKELE